MPNNLQSNSLDTGRLEILVTIINREKADSITDLLQSFEVNMQLAFPGEGTASRETLDLLGLSSQEKTVIFSVIREDRTRDAMEALEKRFSSIRDSKGIACTIPMSSVIGVMIFGFLSNDRRTVKPEQENKK